MILNLRFFRKIHHLLLLALPLILSQNSFAQKAPSESSAISNYEIMREIGKSMVIDRSLVEGIDMDKVIQESADNSKKKSDITIDRATEVEEDSYDKENSDKINLTVGDKVRSSTIRQYEKLAYDSALNGQFEVAAELYKNAILAEPKNYDMQFSLAVIYQKLLQYRQAKYIYYNLLKNNYESKQEVISNLLAIITEESPKEALFLINDLAKQNPQSPEILAQAAIVNYKNKHYQEAVNFLKKAYQLDEGNIQYKYNLAIIYDEQASYRAALATYIEVLKLHEVLGDSQPIPYDKVRDRIEVIKKLLNRNS